MAFAFGELCFDMGEGAPEIFADCITLRFCGDNGVFEAGGGGGIVEIGFWPLRKCFFLRRALDNGEDKWEAGETAPELLST